MVRTSSSKLMTISTVAVIITILASTCIAGDVLVSWNGTWGVLGANEFLEVGDYKFTVQDCSLVLYDKQLPIWVSNDPYPKRGCFALLRETGNLVLHDISGNIIWSTNIAPAYGNYVLVLQKDRNVVIYGSSLWATGTNIKKVGGVVVTAINGTVDGGSRIGRKIWTVKNATALGDVQELNAAAA